MNASGFLSTIFSINWFLSTKFEVLLKQPQQLHLEEHNLPAAKQSQYNLRHLLFLQLQGLVSSIL